MIHIKYSKINQALLEEYYSKYFIDKEKCKRQLLMESVILLVGGIVSFIVILPFTNLFLTWVFSFLPDVDLGPSNLLLIPCFFIIVYKCSGIFPWLGKRLCPLGYRYEVEQELKKDLQEYNRFFEFQDILKKKDVWRVAVDKYDIVAEYTEPNGISQIIELDTWKYTSKIVTEGGLDFTWLDKEIEDILIERLAITMDGTLVRVIKKGI